MIDVASLASLSMHFQNERKKGWKKNKKKKTDFFLPRIIRECSVCVCVFLFYFNFFLYISK